MSERTFTTTTDRSRSRERRSRTASESEAETEQEAEHDGLQCPECSGNVITDDEHGETVCDDCGLVITEDSVDRGPEWRAFDSAEKDQKSRVGAPTTNTMHDKGLSTNI
ncbi:MAG: TFIIB-type zinc ribbon-containing protein, partial [Halohasta sp.]